MSTQYKDYYGTHMPFGQFPKFAGRECFIQPETTQPQTF